MDYPGCNGIKDRKLAQAHSDGGRIQLEECHKITPQGAERWNRRGEVLNEALAEELQRDDLWTERDSRKSATQEMRKHRLRRTQIPRGDCTGNRSCQQRATTRAEDVYRHGSRNTNRSADGD